MSKNYLNAPRESMRRSDRAIEDEQWIIAMLKDEAIGVLATQYDGQPFINSNLFVYDRDRHTVFMHTARVGRTAANVGVAQPVCFSVFRMGRLLPADEALEFSVEYDSVVIFGNARLIDDDTLATDALQQLLDKYAPHLTAGFDYRPPVPEEIKRTAVFAVEIESWTAKRKAVDANFPGAYLYSQVRS